MRGEGEEAGEYSYQVCVECGVKRLFDERLFRGYGSYGYDLHDLIARDRLQRRKRMERIEAHRRTKESQRAVAPNQVPPKNEGEDA
ncbi:MAG TPA: hypothetical protein VN622_06155 [Clostridia bacterium]|nr:hypothetical protein [Clostridia bacterium]